MTGFPLIPGGKKWPVAILGATGAVGQTFIRLLADHPWFEIAELIASERSAGRAYGEAVRWLEGTLDTDIAGMPIIGADPAQIRSPIVFSAVDATVAGDLEKAFARAGKVVLSNAKNHRMDPDVPLVVPEINPDHMGLLAPQRVTRKWTGAIVTNANCAATVAAVALAPLHQRFGIRQLFISTMQAVSGAGYPGVPSLDILGNVIPYIAEEEGKIERELGKILGRFNGKTVDAAAFPVSAHANRVPVEHGHTVCMSVAFETKAGPDEALRALREWKGAAQATGLPSARHAPLLIRDEADRPQPRRDVNTGNGMTVVVGRVRADSILDVRLVAMGHNTIRGAAGGSLMNAELLVSTGSIQNA